LNTLRLSLFLKENIKLILQMLNSIKPERPLKIQIKKARLNIPQEEKPLRYLTLDTTLTIGPNNNLFSFGEIGLDGLTVKNTSPKEDSTAQFYNLNYSLNGILIKEGLIIENLEFKKSELRVKLWGALEKGLLRLNGYSSLSNFFGADETTNNPYGFMDRIKTALMHRGKSGFPIMGISVSDLDVYDFACLIKFNFADISIENLSFTVKDIPFCLKGVFSLSKPQALSLSLASFPNQPIDARLNNPKRIDVKADGTLNKGKFDGVINVEFLRKSRSRDSLENMGSVFKNLSFLYNRDGEIEMLFKKAEFSYASGRNLYNFFLQDFNSSLNMRNKRFKFIKFNSMICDGIIEGDGVIDITQMPLRSYINMRVKGANANKLSGVIDFFSKIYGNLSSQIHFRNYPHPELTGKLTIKDGLLDNMVFFSWLADFFKIPSLKKIKFDALSADFLVNNESAGIDKIYLNNKEITLQGYFTLYENDLVSSKLSLILPKTVLGNSPKFASLLDYLVKDVSAVDFNFQLSGIYQAMNFQWLKSDFKERLQVLLPSWIEKGIENKIEKIIESIYEE
ncbi:MAG: AsmA-like C-terminal region-containing protein, partial [Candidatus Omnitrophota bacterium]